MSDKRIDDIKKKLIQEIEIAVGNHYEVFIGYGFHADVEKSVDDLTDEILKIANEKLIKH